MGTDHIKQDVPSFKVTVFMKDLDDVMIYVSLSHVIADGYTYYKIFKMLDSYELIEPMVYKRKFNYL